MARNSVDEFNIMKELSRKEREAKRNWEKRWGFYLDFKQIIRKEAEKLGLSEEEFYEKVSFKKPQPKYDRIGWEIEPSEPVPRTSSVSYCGWYVNKKEPYMTFFESVVLRNGPEPQTNVLPVQFINTTGTSRNGYSSRYIYSSQTNRLVGWRGDLKYSLERVGPMFVSPLHTMPKREKQNYIILG